MRSCITRITLKQEYTATKLSDIERCYAEVGNLPFYGEEKLTAILLGPKDLELYRKRVVYT